MDYYENMLYKYKELENNLNKGKKYFRLGND